jgi:hypothetical protein
MIYALKAGYGRKGARIGSRDGEAELFTGGLLALLAAKRLRCSTDAVCIARTSLRGTVVSAIRL